MIPGKATDQNLISENQISEITILSNNTLKSYNIPFMPQTQVLGVILATKNDLKELITCLIRYESGGNPNAIGKAGEIGILQFMPTTFSKYSQFYGLDLDIYSSNDQILLATKMLEDDFNNILHWTTAKKCQH